MQGKGIVIFMDNQLLQIQNRTCRIYGTASAEYLLLQMVDEHDLAGMEREVEAIHRQTTQPFCWPLSKSIIGTTICRLGLHRPYGVSRALVAGQGIRLHGWRRLCRASVDSIL